MTTTDPFTELQFRSRSDAVAEKLRDAILAGTLKPGDRLIEQKLAARFGVGQPTLREALKDLELQGFVRKSPNKGSHVTQMTHQDFCRILEVRMALEILAIDLAAPNMTDAALSALEKIVATLEASAAALDLATFHKHDLIFHRTIWDLAENEYLGTTLERVAFGLFAFVLLQRPPGQSGNEFLAAAEQHKEILAGLRSRDPDIAREAFVRSTLKFWGEQHQVSISRTVHRLDKAVSLIFR